MIDTLIDAIQDLFANSDFSHTDIDVNNDASDFLNQLDLQDIDLSQYSADDIREALEYALSTNTKTSLDINVDDTNADAQRSEISFGSAYNNGTYIHTSETVNVQCCGGANKGDFDVYMHNGHKYIDFHSNWIRITKYGYFSYNGNQYYVK